MKLQIPLVATAALAALAFLTPQGAADIIKLKNGETLEGVVVSKDKNYVTIELAAGELGLDASMIDSIDSNAGPKTKDDLASARSASKDRLELANAERDAQSARRRAAAVAAEASASRSGSSPADAAVETAAVENRVENRVDQLEAALAGVKSRREREKLRRYLYSYFFGGPVYDPVVNVTR